MSKQIYLMDRSFLHQLLDDRRELYAIARELKSSDEMRAARFELIATTPINLAPKEGESPKYSIRDGIAHISITGELTPRAETDICGAYTAEALTEYGFIVAATQDADANDDVEIIQYDVDSPGGYFSGLMDAVAAIRGTEKPTIAHVGTMAASAAFWLASQADEITASSIASRFGSIGVALEEYDDTEMLQNAGITRRVYTSSDAPDKRPDTRTEAGQKKIIENLNDIHRVFVRTVAEGRGTTVQDVSDNYGRGGMLIAEDALKVGMIDSIDMLPALKAKQDSSLVVDEESQFEARPQAGEERETLMNKEQLKNEYPDLYAEVKAEGRDYGVAIETARRAELASYIEADPDNSRVREVVEAAIAEGKTVNDINAKLQVAIRDGSKLDGENPPAVATASDDMDGLDNDDREAMRLMGVSAAEYKAFTKEVK